MKSEFWTGDYKEEDRNPPTEKSWRLLSSRYRHWSASAFG